MGGPFNLEHFVAAQNAGRTYDHALAELRRGRKTSHWMWFVFPQLAGLGRSDMARRYAISGLDEARAYLAHDPLGARLRACVEAILDLDETDPAEVLGGIDAVKLRSSMTLFEAAAPQEPTFTAVLDRSFDSARDAATLEPLGSTGNCFDRSSRCSRG